MRKLHWVGSYPLDSTWDTFVELVQAGGDLVPDGEPGRYWVATEIEQLAAQPEVRTVRRGGLRPDREWRRYTDVPTLFRRAGERLSLRLPYADNARQAKRILETVARDTGRDDLRLQVGIPHYDQIPKFTTGLRRDVATFFDATVDQVNQIDAELGDTATVQLELPYQTVMCEWTGRLGTRAQRRYARRIGDEIAAFIASCRYGTHFGLHLCFGDLAHRPLTSPTSTTAVTVLANAITDAWPTSHVLEYVHTPVADGQHPPTTRAAYYAALRDLALPATTALSLGLVHDWAASEDLVWVRDEVERITDREVWISTPCGDGRTDVDRARRHNALRRLLA